MFKDFHHKMVWFYAFTSLPWMATTISRPPLDFLLECVKRQVYVTSEHWRATVRQRITHEFLALKNNSETGHARPGGHENAWNFEEDKLKEKIDYVLLNHFKSCQLNILANNWNSANKFCKIWTSQNFDFVSFDHYIQHFDLKICT